MILESSAVLSLSTRCLERFKAVLIQEARGVLGDVEWAPLSKALETSVECE